VTYQSDSQLPEVTDEQLQQSLAGTKPFTLVVLRAGPKLRGATDRDQQTTSTIWAHGKRNLALRSAGLMPVICPVSDGSDLAGIGILVTTPEEADRIMAGDPAVQSGILTYEVHPTRSFPGSRLPD
jgi:hypothetical protein